MQTKRIELIGPGGMLTIERDRADKTNPQRIRIDSILRNPSRGQQAWVTYEIGSRICDRDLLDMTMTLFHRLERRQPSNAELRDLAGELYRFTD